MIQTTAVLSIFASAIPVIRFVAPGPDVAIHTPGRPEGARIALSGMDRSLFVTDENVSNLMVVLEKGIVYGHDRATRVSENRTDTLLQQRQHDRFRSRHCLWRFGR